jgi:hypothetical protein
VGLAELHGQKVCEEHHEPDEQDRRRHIHTFWEMGRLYPMPVTAR